MKDFINAYNAKLMRQFHLTVSHANYCERGYLSELRVTPKGIIVLLLFMLLPSLGVAQFSFTYSPTSVRGWGVTPDAEMVSFSYKFDVSTHEMELGVLRVNSNNLNITDTVLEFDYDEQISSFQMPAGAPIVKAAIGVYFLPFIYHNNISFVELSLSAGALYFNKRYPTKNAEKLNLIFRLQASTEIYRGVGIALSYTHISNAYTGTINPGMDFPSVSLTYNLY